MAKILIVDDEALISMSTMDMLEDLGHAVLEANSGRQALEILAAHGPVDLVVTDYSMPGMSGTELAALLREKYPSLPVLLATGYAELPSGPGNDLPRISKPYLQNQLQTQIDRLLGQ